MIASGPDTEVEAKVNKKARAKGKGKKRKVKLGLNASEELVARPADDEAARSRQAGPYGQDSQEGRPGTSQSDARAVRPGRKQRSSDPKSPDPPLGETDLPAGQSLAGSRSASPPSPTAPLSGPLVFSANQGRSATGQAVQFHRVADVRSLVGTDDEPVTTGATPAIRQ